MCNKVWNVHQRFYVTQPSFVGLERVFCLSNMTVIAILSTYYSREMVSVSHQNNFQYIASLFGHGFWFEEDFSWSYTQNIFNQKN